MQPYSPTVRKAPRRRGEEVGGDNIHPGLQQASLLEQALQHEQDARIAVVAFDDPRRDGVYGGVLYWANISL